MTYNHDMLHCSQDQCCKKDTCYRYWLGKEFKKHGWTYASFYFPQTPITEGCEYYISNEPKKKKDGKGKQKGYPRGC